MAHGGGDEGGGERWLVSYADFITLLMVMFIVLYSMGQVDVKKYKQLADSMKAAFSLGGAASQVVDAQINQASGNSDTGSPNPIVIPGIPSTPPKSEEVAGELTKMLSDQNLGGEVSIQTNIEGVLISISEKLVYKTGTAELQPEAIQVLNTITGMLKPIDNSIRIVGHTDDTAPIDPRFANNWELSLGRAMVIATDFINGGIKPERIIVSGRGSYDPLFPNDSDAHRAMNGRADIIIIYKVDTNVIGVDSNPISNPTGASSGTSSGTTTGGNP
jgi:chemotaxis protein MotB